MDKAEILLNLSRLNDALKDKNVRGKIALVGGAVMCLVFSMRESTQDIDAIFEPKAIIYACAKIVAQEQGLPDNWLNDSVKGFISPDADFQPHIELSHLEIHAATHEYMLAMKCLSARADSAAELDDIKNLIMFLGHKTYKEVEAVMLKYYPVSRFQIKIKYIIQEVLDGLYA